MFVQTLRLLSDNYTHLVIDDNTQRTLIIDPSEGMPVLNHLQANAYHPQAILITHHHHDHIGGVDDLKHAYPDIAIYATDSCRIGGAIVGEKTLSFFDDTLTLNVLSTPGHTLDHVVYFNNHWLFCGDTLFAGGCGRLLGASARQMYDSLMTLAALPADIKIYCGHDYLKANLSFAKTVEPNNRELIDRWQHLQKNGFIQNTQEAPTLAIELATNPFLRVQVPAVIKAINQWSSTTFEIGDSLAIFTALRRWKDAFLI